LGVWEKKNRAGVPRQEGKKEVCNRLPYREQCERSGGGQNDTTSGAKKGRKGGATVKTKATPPVLSIASVKGPGLVNTRLHTRIG